MIKGILVTLCFLTFASSALACGCLKKADPRVGNTVESADHISLTFSEAIAPDASAIKLMDSTGQEIKTGPLESSNGNTVLSVSVPHLPAGKYKVNWKVFWLDCKSENHSSYTFSVK